jgi:hypothetical protein
MASFLETMLALGLVAGFSTGLFMLSRNQQQAATAILDEFKGSRQGMQALSIVTEELANAKIPLRSVASDSVSFDSVSNPTPVTISLPGGGSSDPLQFNKGSEEAPLNSGRLIQNYTEGLPLFLYYDANGSPTADRNQVRRIEIALLLRPNPDSPVRYLRTSVTLRNGAP